jgi:zinc transport system ATP-binding protein
MGCDNTCPEPVITANDLWFSYGGDPTLQDVCISVAPLDFISIVGPNGGGKTTLLKLILGLLTPNRGEISVLGMSPVQARPKIGYVPQQFQFDYKFPVRVIDVVLMGRLSAFKGLYSKQDRLVAMRALDQVELANYSRRHISELSGGQRQRALIARALATEPKLLLLDEPTAHIDMAAQQDFYKFIERLKEQLTILMVTHDVAFVAPFVKSVLCVNRKVVMHPTQAITPEVIGELYGEAMRFVSHGQLLSPHTEKGHGHD